MWAAIAGIVGLLTAFFFWWTAPGQVRARLEADLKKVRTRITKEKEENDAALASLDNDRLTISDRNLVELRNDEVRLLQRIRETNR